MNIFVTDECPKASAQVLPDKHIVKMPLECCQMLAIVASEKWGRGFGELPNKSGKPYKTEKGAFRNHPCTQWANQTIDNAYWLIKWGLNLCSEYSLRYNKTHSCEGTLTHAYYLFPKGKITNVTPFARAMYDEFKYDDSIDTFTAYKRYIASKPWVCLLYTSPSPRDKRQSRMPSSA